MVGKLNLLKLCRHIFRLYLPFVLLIVIYVHSHYYHIFFFFHFAISPLTFDRREHLCLLLLNHNIQFKNKQNQIRRLFSLTKPVLIWAPLFEFTFDSLDAATRARDNLNGADIYSGCCTLKIDFAKVSTTAISFQQYNFAFYKRQ